MSSSNIICVLGPTGTGKTQAGVALAQALDGEVVNADSRQAYAGLPIITAQPTEAECCGVPHHLYGFIDPRESLSAAHFAHLAQKTIGAIEARGKVPIVVGGTGMYVRALLQGLADIPITPPEIRQRVTDLCNALGPETLHARLTDVDPLLAAKISHRDRQRIIRGLEVYEATGKPLSGWQAQGRAGAGNYRALLLGLQLDRSVLTPRLATRIENMLQQGALKEAASAYGKCPDENAPGFTGIGCRELIAVHLKRLTLDDAKALWLKRTRDYAKRQSTWFRHQCAAQWLAPHEHSVMVAMAREFLG